MSGLIDKRKRSREDDIQCESTPLSKRINNLHLNNFEEAQQNSKSTEHDVMNELHYTGHIPINKSTVNVGLGVGLGVDTSFDSVLNNMYNPELNESQNPFYYEKNKLLHGLHLERIKRCSV